MAFIDVDVDFCIIFVSHARVACHRIERCFCGILNDFSHMKRILFDYLPLTGISIRLLTLVTQSIENKLNLRTPFKLFSVDSFRLWFHRTSNKNASQLFWIGSFSLRSHTKQTVVFGSHSTDSKFWTHSVIEFICGVDICVKKPVKVIHFSHRPIVSVRVNESENWRGHLHCIGTGWLERWTECELSSFLNCRHELLFPSPFSTRN